MLPSGPLGPSSGSKHSGQEDRCPADVERLLEQQSLVSSQRDTVLLLRNPALGDNLKHPEGYKTQRSPCPGPGSVFWIWFQTWPTSLYYLPSWCSRIAPLHWIQDPTLNHSFPSGDFPVQLPQTVLSPVPDEGRLRRTCLWTQEAQAFPSFSNRK